MPPLLCTACRSVTWEYTFPIRWTVSGVKNEPRSFSVHLTLGTAALEGGVHTSQAVFYALSFFWLDGFAVPRPSAGIPLAPLGDGGANRWAAILRIEN